MALFKCKMCGGTIEFEPGASVGICDSCGTKQTLPRLDNDRKTNLYDRANHFRRNNDFDKASGIYEQILNDDPSDAEAYWSLVLCRYGIEYVEDPATHKRIPTVNRAQFTSVFDDDNYKSALERADSYQRAIYEEEANTINEIQKGILAISQKEEPFDVFICYKETDNNGRRTQDSVLANDLYHQLTQEGFKVFFSRITLEDKLGTAYEPYIFAALNSAKVMVVLGTRPEYFNAVWVKNEWSRYLALVRQSNGKKMLIPAYRDMDPYDLPEEFSHLQAQDMSKLGFMQDLIRGIKKIISADEVKKQPRETVVSSVANANIAPILRRAFMFLEDGDWSNADEYCEKVLDQDPENAQAYLGKLMAEVHVQKQEDLQNCEKPFDGSSNYQKALRFGDASIKDTLTGAVTYINERNENERLEGIYVDAQNKMNTAKSEDAFKIAASGFGAIPGYKDADVLQAQCLELAENARKDAIYENAIAQMKRASFLDPQSNYKSAIKTFETIPGWKDSDQQIRICLEKIEEIKAKEERERLERERKAEQDRIEAEKAAKKKKRNMILGGIAVAILAAVAIVWTQVIVPGRNYGAAMKLYENGDYENASLAFSSLGDYKDSGEWATKAYNAYLKKANIGSTIRFGNYKQGQGTEPIEWQVLAKENNRILVISKYALDCKQYNTSNTSVTWATCSLRSWLNSTFMETAFSSAERSMIPTVTVSADKNPEYSTNPGNSTSDQVFLLSINEVNKYFASNSARACQATKYAYDQGAYKADNGNCWWWLRSPGCISSYAAYVYYDGSVSAGGSYVSRSSYAVRPALWINLEP